MKLMDFVNKEYFESDDEFNKCIEKLKGMKERFKKNESFCYFTDCDECIFEKWCDNDKSDMLLHEFFKHENIILKEKDFFDYFIPSLILEYKNYKATKSDIKVPRPTNIKIIKKIKDFDGLDNGMGLRFEIVQECHEDDIYYFLILRTEKKEFERWVLTDKALITYLDFFKAMGFIFEYKPPRTKEEIYNDIEVSAREFSDVFNCVVTFQKGKWIDVEIQNDSLPTRKYLTAYAAKALANELNEISNG